MRAFKAGAANSEECCICLVQTKAAARAEGQLGTLMCPVRRRKQSSSAHSFCFPCIRACLILKGNSCPICKSEPSALLRYGPDGVRQRLQLPLKLNEVERAVAWAQHQEAQLGLEELSRARERLVRREGRRAAREDRCARSASWDAAIARGALLATREELGSPDKRAELISLLRQLEQQGERGRGRTRTGPFDRAEIAHHLMESAEVAARFPAVGSVCSGAPRAIRCARDALFDLLEDGYTTLLSHSRLLTPKACQVSEPGPQLHVHLRRPDGRGATSTPHRQVRSVDAGPRSHEAAPVLSGTGRPMMTHTLSPRRAVP